MTIDSQNYDGFLEENLQNKGDKARAVAKMGQELLKRGFTHTQAKNASEEEIKHAMADGRQTLSEVSLRKRGNLTIPTYTAVGQRTDEELIKIANAVKDPSPTDLEVAQQAKVRIENKRKKFLGIF